MILHFQNVHNHAWMKNLIQYKSTEIKYPTLSKVVTFQILWYLIVLKLKTKFWKTTIVKKKTLLKYIFHYHLTGIQTSKDARFYALSAKFENSFSNEDKDLVVQFTVKHEQKIDCGGGYVKVFSSELDQEGMHGDSPYNIMFGRLAWLNCLRTLCPSSKNEEFGCVLFLIFLFLFLIFLGSLPIMMKLCTKFGARFKQKIWSLCQQVFPVLVVPGTA